MKRPYLVAYDYGMGAVWMYILARSPEEIAARYAELQVVPQDPPWMTDAERQKIFRDMTFDIDQDEGTYLARFREDAK